MFFPRPVDNKRVGSKHTPRYRSQREPLRGRSARTRRRRLYIWPFARCTLLRPDHGDADVYPGDGRVVDLHACISSSRFSRREPRGHGDRTTFFLSRTHLNRPSSSSGGCRRRSAGIRPGVYFDTVRRLLRFNSVHDVYVQFWMVFFFTRDNDNYVFMTTFWRGLAAARYIVYNADLRLSNRPNTGPWPSRFPNILIFVGRTGPKKTRTAIDKHDVIPNSSETRVRRSKMSRPLSFYTPPDDGLFYSIRPKEISRSFSNKADMTLWKCNVTAPQDDVREGFISLGLVPLAFPSPSHPYTRSSASTRLGLHSRSLRVHRPFSQSHCHYTLLLITL